MADEVDPIIADMRREQQEATTQYGKIPPANSTPVPKLEHPIDTSTDISVKSPTYQRSLGHGQFEETPVQGYDAGVANTPDFPPQQPGTGGSAAVDAAQPDAAAQDPNEDPVVAEMKAEQAKADAQAGALLDYRSKNDAMEPGRRGDVLRYSAASGLEPTFVSDHLDEVKRNVDAQKVDWNRVVQEQPALTQYLLDNPQTTPLVRADAANLKPIEFGITSPFVAFYDALNEQRSIARQFLEAEGMGSEENRAKIKELDEQSSNKDYGANTWLQKGLIGFAKGTPFVVGDLAARFLGASVGTAIGGEAGAAVGGAAGAPEAGAGAVPGAAIGAAGGVVTGGAIGQFAGSGLFNYYETVGPLYKRLSELKDANGQPLDPSVVQAFAQSGAIVTSGLMAGFFGKVTSNLPGVKSLMGRFTSDAVEKAAVDASVQALAKRGAAEFGKHWLTGAALMAGQSALAAASEEGAKAASSQPFDVHWSNIGNAAASGFKSGLEDMWLLSAIGPGKDFLKEVGRGRASAESTVRLQGMAESAKESTLLEHFPQGFRDLVSTMKENPDAVKNVFIPAEEWATYFQEKNLDPGEVAAGVLGDQGKAYNEALTTKGDLVIPVEQFLSKLATSEHGDALLEHSKLAPDELTPRQFADQQKVVAERMKEAAQERAPELAEGKKAVGDFIREQAIEAGLGKEEATKNAELVANYATTMATRLGISVREAAALGSLGRLRVLGPKGEAVARAAQERFQEFLRPNASQFLERRLSTLSPENRGREYYVDPVSGLRNRRAFDATPSPEGKQVAVITSPDVKGINDHPTAGGHDVANDFLRQVGSALGEVDPEAARSGTNFLFHVDSQEQLDAAVKKVQAALGNDKLHILGAAGENVDAAFKAVDAKTTEGRASKALPERGKLHPELDVGSLKFSEEKAKATVPEHLVGELSKLSDAEYARKVYQDRIETTEDGKKVSMPTGMLTAEGWRAVPRKANVVSLDAKGLKLVNDRLGKTQGDKLLFVLADTLAHFGGSDFDVAHLSGDEFAAQHDDPAKLEAFVTRVKDALQTRGFKAEDTATGKWVNVPVDFRHGIGSTYGEADRDLNTRKRAEAGNAGEPQDNQPRGARGDEAGATAAQGNNPGRQDSVGAGSEPRGAAGADEEGPPAVLSERRGATRQDVGAEVVSHLEGAPVTFEQPAFHGSPHRFDNFSLHKIGTGEGAQVYGWGLYFASEKAVAEHYRKRLTSSHGALIDGKTWNQFPDAEQRHFARALAGSMDEGFEQARSDALKDAKEQGASTATLAWLENLKESSVQRPGALYQVDLPEHHELLDYDEPLSKQHKSVREAVDALTKKFSGYPASEIENVRATKNGDIEAAGVMSEATGEEVYRYLIEKLGTPAKASQALLEQGVPGLRYIGERRHTGTGSHNFVIWDDSRVKTTATYYAGPEGTGARGTIKLQLDPNGRPREFAIQVLNGDKSTFLHETAHFLSWSLHDIATSDLATPELKSDYTELLKWAGYDSTEQRLAETTERAELSSKAERTPEEQRRLTALSAKEERISHGWEQYLFEGKAPSSALGRVFTRFKNWMVGIYQGVAGLQAQYRAQYGQELGLSDNVRAIFDRLLAQDDALKQAQEETGAPAAPTPEALANMSPTEAAAYRRALDRASFASDAELNRRAAEIQSKQMDGARERVQAEVTQKVDAQPVYRAWRYLETGRLVDENGQVQATAPFPETYKLSREQFTKEYGKDAAKKLPRQLFGATKKAGVSADELAPLLGFNSGDELAKQLTQAVPRDRAISQQVQGQLNSEYGPVLQGIQDAAMASVHNDAAAHAMLLELRGLAKDVDPATRNRVSSMSLETLKATAADIVSATTVGELDPARYARTERQTALKAAELLGRGKKEEALDQKEARLLNQVLYREARDASEQLDKVHDKLEGTSDSIRANLGKADPAYRDAHDQLLAAVGLGESGGVADPGVLDALLKRADADAQDVAFDVDRIRQLINQPKDWEQLTVDDARAVADAVTNIRHIARETLDIQLEGKKVEKAAFMQSVADRVASVRPAQPAEPYSRTAEGIGTKLRAARRGALTMLEDVETWAEMMDGGTEGPAHQLLIGARLEARASEAKLQAEVLKPIKKLWDEMPKEIQKVRAEKVNVGDLLPVPEKAKSLVSPTYTRDQLWSLFLNWGNEGNRQRIRDGNGWTDANVTKALGLLSKPELKFLQGVLDTIDSLYPALAKSYEKRTGLTLDRVASTPIELNGETYRGGYFALKYDARFAKAGEVQEGQVVKSLFQPNYVKPTVASSHTKSRVERVDQPVDLTWGTVPAHLSQVVHDISYGDWVRQAGGILLDPRFQAPVTQFLGPERAKQFVPWLRDVANNRVDSSAGYVSDFMRNAENFGRSRLALASIGLNIPALARHTFDPWTALADSEGVRPQHIIGGYLKVMNPANWNAMPEFGLSKEIAYRDTMHEENLRTELAKISPKQEGAMRRIITSVAFKGSAWMDHFTSRVIFKAAYDQGIADGLNEQDAAKRGDDVVRRSLPAGDIAEKPPILRTKQGLASAVMFYGYASKMYNLRARAFDAAWRSWNSETEQPADKAMAIATVAAKFMAVGAVSALGSYFAGRGWKKDEDPVAWTGSEVALSPLDDIPLVGPMVKKALTGHKVNVAAAPTMALVGEWLEKVGDMAQHHTGSQRESDQIWGWVQGVLSAFGPAGQVGRTVGYLKKVDSGESRPRGPLDVAGGLIYGEGKNPSVNPLTDLQGAVQ